MSGHREAFGFGYSTPNPSPAELAALAEKIHQQANQPTEGEDRHGQPYS